ncbi:TIGR01440 family protein [Ruminococcaceae bacterium OttesenSCG-928-O06]|nr:TIGR01440 family protein [Ruminococcaceae bacterium OttesenSCG-928-O06]
MDFLEQTRTQAAAALLQLLDVAKLQKGDLMVVGCSTSEVAGHTIGTHPGPQVADALLKGMLPLLQNAGLYLAAQCCEHLGRALVVEEAALQRWGLVQVNAVPQPKAGGSFATAAYAALRAPVLVANVQAAAGLDIGHTLIGMHLRAVAVPVRLAQSTIGAAPVVVARTRPPFVGGARAVYNEALL